ncbi:MAG: Na/Pi symporter [Melioribacteraceae bacterium]|nr:Na/Pi symporter [Melioribacteraceae bacterium]
MKILVSSNTLHKLSIIAFVIILTTINFGQINNSIEKVSLDTTKVSIVIANQPNGNGPVIEIIHQTAEELLKKPFRVRVLFNGNKPIKNWPVYFSIIAIPAKSKGTLISQDMVLTDEDGYAETYARLGTKKGNYEFSAKINNLSAENNIVFFKAYARSSSWIFYLISGLIGGLGLFLFGMEMMSEGMKRTAGSKMRSILGTITNNRFVAVGVGTFVTMVIQSSSATTVMLVSFVQAKLMTFAQSLGIILGADIGTTITAQLIAFKLTDYALLVIGVGFGLMFLSKTKKLKNIGEVILGFGLLFFGMWVMSNAMYPLRTYEPFIQLLLHLENPILGILIGAIFTALIQSSSAFTGIIIVLGSQGLITLEAAIPLLLGANIGTSVTAALASINVGREAKRVALAHALFKVLGVALFAWWIPYYSDLIRMISPSGSVDLSGTALLAEVVPRQIANAHTVFNVALTLIVLPFTTQAATWIIKILPDIKEVEEESQFQTKYLEENLINTPVLALSLTKAEIIRMATKVQKMVSNILSPFFTNDSDKLDVIREQESEINYLNLQISRYLMKISQESIGEERTDEIFQMMHSVTEVEQIGDIVSKRLIPLAEKKMKLNVYFSKAGQEEIKDFHLRSMKQISRAIEVFKDVNLKDAKKMEKKYKKYRLMEMGLRRTHFDRLREDIPESVATSEIHLELIEMLKRISSHATNIARVLLEQRKEKEEEATLKAQLSKIEKRKKKNSSEITEEKETDNNNLTSDEKEIT